MTKTFCDRCGATMARIRASRAFTASVDGQTFRVMVSIGPFDAEYGGPDLCSACIAAHGRIAIGADDLFVAVEGSLPYLRETLNQPAGKDLVSTLEAALEKARRGE
jgi:hypothetical protein